MRYLLAYDIACPKRLRRVARLMERQALRIQKSVFVTDLSWEGVQQLLAQVREVISPQHDIVQAWRLAMDQPPEGMLCGSCLPLYPASVVHDNGQNYLVPNRSQRKR